MRAVGRVPTPPSGVCEKHEPCVCAGAADIGVGCSEGEMSRMVNTLKIGQEIREGGCCRHGTCILHVLGILCSVQN